jgi:hypothetical protein
MKLVVSYKIPGRGIYKVLLSSKEHLQFTRGRARRVPADSDEGVTNSIPIKYITSIKVLSAQPSVCSACSKEADQLLCFDCIAKVASKGK